MRLDQLRSFDSVRRVPQFMDSNGVALSAYNASPARKQIDAVVVATTAFATTQAGADRQLTGLMSSQKALMADLKTNHMIPIAKFSRAQLQDVPDFAALTKSTKTGSPNNLVLDARGMATAAAAHLAALITGGFPADTVTQLSAATDALVAVLKQRELAKSARVAATKGISEQLVIGRKNVKSLDAAITKQFAKDKVFLAGWRLASRITAKTGAARNVGVVVPSATTPAVGPVTSLVAPVVATMSPVSTPVSAAVAPVAASAAPATPH